MLLQVDMKGMNTSMNMNMNISLRLLPVLAICLLNLQTNAFTVPSHMKRMMQEIRHVTKKDDYVHKPALPFTPRSRSSSSSSSSSTTELYGIPKMFRWLTDQYPNINSRLSEGLSNDKIVDNFYLDMNGIIHPCTHGNNQDEIVVLDETAMFKKIFGYVDR
jgi:hypothetical protein